MQTKHKLNRLLFIFGLMISFFSAAFPLVQAQSAAPGDLDPTFGNGGIVFTGGGARLLAASDMAIQSDGKIVVVGSRLDDYDFVVLRGPMVRNKQLKRHVRRLPLRHKRRPPDTERLPVERTVSPFPDVAFSQLV